MGKSKGSTVTTSGIDPSYAGQVWSAAQNAANVGAVGPDQSTLDATTGFRNAANAGNLGFGALSGNPADIAKFMNPYQDQVIGGLNTQYQHDLSTTMNGVAGDATAAGAFGGTRQGVAQGVAAGELARNHQQQVGQLLDQGYQGAMGHAGMLANLGFGANGALASMGDYMHQLGVQNNPAMRQYQFLSGAAGAMPHTTTETQTPGHNGVSGALGGAATGAELGSHFGPWGTGIGAGIGGLLGMFS